MEENIDFKSIANHWIEMSDKDFNTMNNLHKSRDYHWSLFMGHLVIERLIKACIVNETKNHAPFSHDLLRLSVHAKMELPKEYLDWLDTITTFNLNTRYDSYKQEFYKKCTDEYTTSWIEKIKTLRSWIKQKHLE